MPKAEVKVKPKETKPVEPWAAVCVQAYWELHNPDIRKKFGGDALKKRNLRRMCDYIDAGINIGAQRRNPKLFCFPEFSIGGLYAPRTTTAEVKKYQAITIPGPETEVLAKKAKEHGVYIAGCNHENDPDWPDFFFNTAFIINPKGKIILKYRKGNVSFGLNAHDVWEEYRDPITGKQDAFPVVDTAIGRLCCMICGDTAIPEIPRIYAFKGGEVLCRLSSGYSWELARQTLRVRANDNTIYVVAENWAARAISFQDMGAAHVIDSVDTDRGGGSMIIGYNGNVIAEALGPVPQLVVGTIDIEALRRARNGWREVHKGTGSFVPYTRTEFYRPYYNKTIFPPNMYFEQGPMKHSDDESVTKRRQMAVENYHKMYDFYSEDDVR